MVTARMQTDGFGLWTYLAGYVTEADARIPELTLKRSLVASMAVFPLSPIGAISNRWMRRLQNSSQRWSESVRPIANGWRLYTTEAC